MTFDRGSILALKMAVPDSTLRTLRLWSAGLNAKVMEDFLDMILASPIENLMLDNNPMDEKCVDNLVKMLEGKSKLVTISLQSNNLRDEDIERLFKATSNTTTLITANFSKNKASEKALGGLLGALQSNSVLQAVDLSRNEIGDEEVELFMNTLVPVDEGGKKKKTKPVGLKVNSRSKLGISQS
eukprot:CAMPEP_0184504156 /NCGR_PEP_ID=MMETSP0113_2-20130426/52312_1 /TAXON_ID=91329 /ORGANISM="Norrisiella sphaerica, Strain BC52" /LENGTH=183 /DNA_ID=CAMNT_0026893775 /DNA_START=10 /DNA_END=561 /DNA_ORIENTATION=+